MKYLLDFDGVIFDTESLKAKMTSLQLQEAERSASLFEDILARDPHFDIASLMFSDARVFLTRHRGSCIVVSSYISSNPLNNQAEDVQELYQRKKIELSGALHLVGTEHVHVVGASKAQALRELRDACASAGEECLFIDDHKVYVEEALQLGMRAFLMDRYTQNESAEDSFTRLRSFDDVAQLVWQK